MEPMEPLVIAGRTFASRLIVGTGKYKDGPQTATAIAEAHDSVLMAEAMGSAVEAGRKAHLAGRIEKKLYASASSPLHGVVR